MVHLVLVILSYAWIAALVGCMVLALVVDRQRRTKRTRALRPADLAYERYAAEQAIRDIERRTIQAMLDVYHREKRGGDEVIESTAVEVKK